MTMEVDTGLLVFIVSGVVAVLLILAVAVIVWWLIYGHGDRGDDW